MTWPGQEGTNLCGSHDLATGRSHLWRHLLCKSKRNLHGGWPPV